MKTITAKIGILLFSAVLFNCLYAMGYDFSAQNEDGVTIYYKILNEADKTCATCAMVDRSSWSGGDTLTDYVGDVRIPPLANGYRVTRIGDHTFSCCQNVTSVTVPSTVETIGSSAFWYCTGMTSITLPDGITSIGWTSFDHCTGLTSISLPASLTEISSCMLEGCSGLTSITIPNSVTKIGKSAFYECTGLTSVTIPESVTVIDERAFEFCSSLPSVTIPNSVNTIGLYAFGCCDSLTSITVPKSVTAIGNLAFSHNPNLETIVVEEGNPNYTSGDNCNGIIEISTNTLIAGCKNTIIPNTVEAIGVGVFRGCFTLTSLEIPNSVKRIESSALSFCGLTSIELPDSLEYIGNSAFCATPLTSITIPNSVTTISEHAFYLCYYLESVNIPASVTFIGKEAFASCTGLTTVTSYVTDVFETGEKAFINCNNATLYVPAGLVSTYQATADWNRLNIEEMSGVSLKLACSDWGKVTINDTFTFTNKVCEATVYDGEDSKFVFTPDENYLLDRVLLNGLDVTRSIRNNQLTTTILPNSTMMVIFSSKAGDMNGDGHIDVSDVTTLINAVLENNQ